MSVSETYKLCVGMGGMSPEYFKTKLRPSEAELYLEGLDMRRRDSWEQARMITNPWRSSESEPIIFPWETAKIEAREITSEVFEELKQWGADTLVEIKNHG